MIKDFVDGLHCCQTCKQDAFDFFSRVARRMFGLALFICLLLGAVAGYMIASPMGIDSFAGSMTCLGLGVVCGAIGGWIVASFVEAILLLLLCAVVGNIDLFYRIKGILHSVNTIGSSLVQDWNNEDEYQDNEDQEDENGDIGNSGSCGES